VLLNDLTYTVRVLRKTPLFTIAVLLTVALGIGVNTAIFSVVNGVLVRPLPFHEPDRLVWVAERNDKLGLPTFTASALNYLSWKEQTQSLDGLGAIGFASFNLSGQGDPEQFAGSTITPSVFPLLGLHPVAGRAFQDGEDEPGRPPVVMISEGLWKRRFGADGSLVGRSLTLNGLDYLVAGVVPAALGVIAAGDVWVPLVIDPGRENRLNHLINVVGRLRPGLTLEQAQAEMDTVASRVGRDHPEVKDWGIRLVTFPRWIVGDQLRTALLVLLGAVACVLLIACANVANLLLARGVSREKEMAVRAAIGASRGRLLRQLLVESLVLSLLGGGGGLLAAFGAVHLFNVALPANLLPVPDVHIDATVLLFALALTVVTGLLFGIAPGWHAARTELAVVLKQAARSSTGGARPLLRKGLAAAELALATVLLVAAGLLGQSLQALQRVDLGFRPEGLLTFQLSLPPARYPAGGKAFAFYRELLESLRSLPGVRDAAISSGIPFGVGNYTATPVGTVGPSVLPVGTAVAIDARWRSGSRRAPTSRGSTPRCWRSSPSSPWRSPRSGPTAYSPTPSASGRAKSACGWRSARPAAAWCG
jgi:predicted permease